MGHYGLFVLWLLFFRSPPSTFPQRRGYLLGACFRESLIIRLHSEIGQIHLSIEAQCDHLFSMCGHHRVDRFYIQENVNGSPHYFKEFIHSLQFAMLSFSGLSQYKCFIKCMKHVITFLSTLDSGDEISPGTSGTRHRSLRLTKSASKRARTRYVEVSAVKILIWP